MVMKPGDPRGTQAWKRLRKEVLAANRYCQIQLPGCTGKATCVDHIKPVDLYPELALVRSNCRPSCLYCNAVLGNRITPRKVITAQDAQRVQQAKEEKQGKGYQPWYEGDDLTDRPPALAFFDVPTKGIAAQQDSAAP
ncbi:HNH endonuclease [Mycobacterium sp. 3-98]|uniref:HNH endonuclease n=1 Tax=Mycobacterium sp. 3-98 TaxID=3042317 RepID=UPI002DDA51D0|nr:HNH endonuclease signature motif containing protein [Mycobacterium sp. 3-98]WSE45582.1 HNH endonuclease signature motif containing protein [Mycobacterium sp. 3-98]